MSPITLIVLAALKFGELRLAVVCLFDKNRLTGCVNVHATFCRALLIPPQFLAKTARHLWSDTMKLRFLLLSILILFSCSCTKLIWTVEPIIEKPSDFDFGFEGKWAMLPDPRFPDRETEEIEIIRDKKDRTKYSVPTTSSSSEQLLYFTAVRLADDSNCAIVQVKFSEREGELNYFYAYAQVEKNRLTIWTVDSEKLVKRLKEKRINSVIDRRSYMTEITAEPSDLLKTLRKDFHELVSKPRLYRRVLDKS